MIFVAVLVGLVFGVVVEVVHGRAKRVNAPGSGRAEL